MDDVGRARLHTHSKKGQLQLLRSVHSWALSTSKDERVRKYSGQHVPVSDHPHNKEIFIIVWSEPPLAQLCVIPMSPVIS